MKYSCTIFFLLLTGIYSCTTRLPVATNVVVSNTLEMDTAGVQLYATALKEKLNAAPNDSATAKQLDLANKYLLACSYYEGGGWSWAVKTTGLNFTKRMYAAAAMLREITEDPSHPLYYKSLYLRGRIFYWLGREDSGFFPDTVSQHHFALLSNAYPAHEVLQMYMGKKISFNSHTNIEAVKGAPLWAVYQREAMHRMLQVIHWWVNEKQAINGEMGGKYGDDVELLRWWLPAILGADDSTATLGYTRLADGVWNSGILERGFAKRVDDVEHSAELFRDTHPGMFLIKYGDPEYVERCMVSMQNFKDVWTGITPRGHRHFKSYYLSASQVMEEAPFGVDVPLNARAALPGLWVAWYNQNPDILQSFEEWGQAWIEDAARQENGKPAGIFPAAVTYKSDKIGGATGTWYDAELAYSYYKWESLGHISELYTHLLGMYAITNNKNYLQPVESVLKVMSGKASQYKIGDPGSLDWVKKKLAGNEAGEYSNNHPMSKVFSMARKVSGDRKYDDFVVRYGQPYNQFEVTNDKSNLFKGFDELLTSLRYNLPLLTSEVKFTDRVYVPGSNLLLGMYTGHFGAGFEFPALVATWKNTGPDVSIFVRRGNNRSALVSLFNAGEMKKVTMRTWQLEPGSYKVKEGIDTDDDGVANEFTSEKTIVLKERVNSIEIALPSKRNFIVSIEQTRSDAANHFLYPDPALTNADIKLADTVLVHNQAASIEAAIHNIGNQTAKNVVIQLLIDGVVAGSLPIENIEAPNDLYPRTKKLSFKWVAQAGVHTVGVKIITGQPEITSLNNYATRTITVLP